MKPSVQLGNPSIPDRPRAAALRTDLGDRLGRFGLHEDGDGRWHRWEWLEQRWPDRTFYMVPDPFEPAPDTALSQLYGLPAEIRTASVARIVNDLTTCHRIYDVLRVDGMTRRLATLVVTEHALQWLDVGNGGALEVAPGWLQFVPRPVAEGPFTRRLIQRIERPRRSARGSTEPPTEPTSGREPGPDLLYRAWLG